MLRKVLVLMLAIGLVGGIIGAASALFTDTASVSDGLFTTGRVDISTNPVSSIVSFNNMMPGDSTIAPVTVSNSGNVQFRYALYSTATNADSKLLMTQLDLTIIKVATTGDCDSDAFTSPAPEDVLYATGDVGSLTGRNLIGDPTTGEDTGDRELAPLGSEVLCFQVALPINTDNTFQNASTTATFNFVAEQTANNP